MGRADLSDAQWARLAPLLPRATKAGRPPMWTKHQLIDGIRWRVRVGSPWRDVPPRHRSWQAVYGLFGRWQRGGSWGLILKLLQVHADAAGRIRWQASVDSTITVAASMTSRRSWFGPIPGRVDHEAAPGARTRTQPLSLLITGGQAGDSPPFTTVLEAIDVPRLGLGRPRSHPDRVLADKAYSSHANRARLRRRGIRATIPIPANQTTNRRNRGSAGGRVTRRGIQYGCGRQAPTMSALVPGHSSSSRAVLSCRSSRLS
ncbi:IS5 family transposase [Nocardia anaemiae]|uniref:IS5 family transposase n=1 Tax=Nocardia anaemiae TaxID=263910 RepID=UPI0007A44EDD|nr:IS5 family transposase [Nocardia anaemiae]